MANKTKRNEYYRANDPNKRLFYEFRIPLQVDKLVYETLVKHFGKKETEKFIERYYGECYMDSEVGWFITHGEGLTTEEEILAKVEWFNPKEHGGDNDVCLVYKLEGC